VIIKAGVTGFGKNRLLTLMEITNVLKNIKIPYIYSREPLKTLAKTVKI